jgi:hypothetical protein
MLTTNGGTLGFEAEDIWYLACPQEAYTQEWLSQPFNIPNTTVNSVSNGILNVTSTSNDPMIEMPSLGSFDPTIYRYINIRYRVTSGTANGVEIFFYNTAHNYAVGGETGFGNLVSDNTWRTVSVDMWSDPDYLTGGSILGWRFDWATASGVTMDIDFITLSTQPIIGEGSSINVSPSSTTTYYTHKKGACNTTTCASQPVTVNPINTATSLSPSACINEPLPSNLTITTTGATGIGAPTNLPTGVNASWLNNTITISGTPTTSGSFNFSIPLTGGCGTVNASGTLTINAPPSIDSISPP